MSEPTTDVPADQTPDTPMERVVDRLDAEGFDGQFRAVEGAAVQCLTCRAVAPASELRMDDVTRLEGVSDPADMAVVLPLRCPSCGTRGTLVLPYGPSAGPEEAEVLRAMERHPVEGTTASTSPDPTPGIDGAAPTAAD